MLVTSSPYVEQLNACSGDPGGTICSIVLQGEQNPWAYLVRVEGLEPPHLAAPEPKSGASTNFAILALWCRLRDSNSRPTDYKSVALPAELKRRYLLTLQLGQKSPCPSSVLHSGHLVIILSSLLLIYTLSI